MTTDSDLTQAALDYHWATFPGEEHPAMTKHEASCRFDEVAEAYRRERGMPPGTAPLLVEDFAPTRYHLGDTGISYPVADDAAARLQAVMNLHCPMPWECACDPEHEQRTCYHCLTMSGDHSESVWPCETARAFGVTL